MGRLTRSRPKALMEIEGETLLARLVRQCAAAGVDRVHVVVGHEAQQVEQALDDLRHLVGIETHHNRDFSTSNNIVSLKLGLEELATSHAGDLLLLECDVVLDEGVLPALVEDPAEDLAVVSPFRMGMDGTVVRLDGQHVRELITTAQQGPYFRHEGTHKTVNIYKLSHALWSSKLPRLIDWYVDEIGRSSYYENAIGMVAYASGDSLSAMVISPDAWHEVDDPNDLRVARSKFSRRVLAAELERSHGGWWDFDVVDHSYLRNMYFPPPALVAQLRQRLEVALGDYGSSQAVLDEKMSWFIESDTADTVALGGLSAAYPLLTDTLDRPDTLIPTPTFGEYSRRYGQATFYEARASLAEISERVASEGSRHVVIVNPNNPTGTLHDNNDVAALARDHQGTTFWVDESFLPFTGMASLGTSTSGPDNIVVLASLSKTFGVPGLRLGYAWSRDHTILEGLRERLPIWAIPSVAEIFLALAMKFKQEYAASLDRSAEDKAGFEAALAMLPGVLVTPAVHGPFVLAEAHQLPASAAEDVVTALLDEGILVKDVTRRLAADHPMLRIAVRTPPENERLADSLGRCLARATAT